VSPATRQRLITSERGVRNVIKIQPVRDLQLVPAAPSLTDRNVKGRCRTLVRARTLCADRIRKMHWLDRWWPRDRDADSLLREMYPHLRPTLRQRLRTEWNSRFDWPHKKARRAARY
jgi:hypothetical protein